MANGYHLWHERHPLVGIVVFSFLCLQPILGTIERLHHRKHGGRSVWAYLHVWNGRIFVTIGMINAQLGLLLAETFGNSLGRRVKIAYGVVSAITWLLWMGSAVWGEWKKTGVLGLNKPQRKGSEPRAVEALMEK